MITQNSTHRRFFRDDDDMCFPFSFYYVAQNKGFKCTPKKYIFFNFFKGIRKMHVVLDVACISLEFLRNFSRFKCHYFKISLQFFPLITYQKLIKKRSNSYNGSVHDPHEPKLFFKFRLIANGKLLVCCAIHKPGFLSLLYILLIISGNVSSAKPGFITCVLAISNWRVCFVVLLLPLNGDALAPPLCSGSVTYYFWGRW